MSFFDWRLRATEEANATSRWVLHDKRGRFRQVLLSQVIPMLQGNATDQTPPDLPSFLFKERIVYLVGYLQLVLKGQYQDRR